MRREKTNMSSRWVVVKNQPFESDQLGIALSIEENETDALDKIKNMAWVAEKAGKKFWYSDYCVALVRGRIWPGAKVYLSKVVRFYKGDFRPLSVKEA